MIEAILTLNTGSSSVKFQLFARRNELPLLAAGQVADIGIAPVFSATCPGKTAAAAQKLPAGSTHEDAVRALLDWIDGHESDWTVSAVAHRIVHGGTEFTDPVRITPDILRKLQKLCPLAPLHQPHNIAAVDIVDRLMPHLPQIACFDTAFHAGHGPLFSLFALPQDMADKGVRRYGFHGLSYEWITHVLAKEHPGLAKTRVIAAHLGNGSSLCAIVNGKSVDTTMGMTALDGVPMGTRCGALDAGAVIYMIRELGLSPIEAEHIFYEQSGVKGLSGLTSDVKTLLESADPKARFALDYYALHIAQYMMTMAVSAGGIDGIVFTGGIGENAGAIRDAVMRHIAFIGAPQVLVIPANEERMMAMHALDCLKDGA